MISDSRQRYNKVTLRRELQLFCYNDGVVGKMNDRVKTTPGLTMHEINNYVARFQSLILVSRNRVQLSEWLRVNGLLHISHCSTLYLSRMTECGSRSDAWTA
jgi:hypothetical protein